MNSSPPYPDGTVSKIHFGQPVLYRDGAEMSDGGLRPQDRTLTLFYFSF